MSLAALAIRACTFLTLWRRTLAEDRVYDSRLVPIDDMIDAGPRPFLTIAIDEATSGKDDGGSDLLGPFGSLKLVIEIGLGVAVSLPARDGAPDAAVLIPDTEPGLEWSLDILSYQIRALLAGGQAGTDPWADLWKRFRMRVNDVTAIRGGMASGGARAALRQIAIDLHPISDPGIGRPPASGSVWADFLDALRALPADADPDLAAYHGLADAVEAAMAAPAGLADWQVAAARLGITAISADALGIVPVTLTDPEADSDGPLLDTIELYAGEAFAAPLDETRADEIDTPPMLEEAKT